MKSKNIIGWGSAFLIVLAYFLLASGHTTSESIDYNLINFLGGCGLAYRVYLDKNYSNFVLELVFIGIALYQILKLCINLPN